MSHDGARPALGLDFGTTNTVFARAGADGGVQPIMFAVGEDRTQTLRTALCFGPDSRAGGGAGIEAGPWAIAQFLAEPEDSRFLQSLKAYAASPHFSGATLFAKRYGFEDLMRLVLEKVKARDLGAGADWPERIVVGRPVRFAGAGASEALALERYQAALQALGFRDILYVPEPVAAAFHYASSLREPATILVADLGGGTSDFSILRFHPTPEGLKAEPLAQSGIPIAGDQFDYRIVDHLILPKLGKGSTYRSMGKVLEIPPSLFSNFARWNLLSVFRGSSGYKDLLGFARTATEPDKLQRFIGLVDENRGFDLYRAISRAKAALSSQERAEVDFSFAGAQLGGNVARADFDRWIADDLRRIEAALDVALMEAGVESEGVTRVFLTGGTSFIPAVRALLARRFGDRAVASGDELISIASGLARIGARDDAERWGARIS